MCDRSVGELKRKDPLDHHISASSSAIFVDGHPKHVEIVSRHAVRIGCTTIDNSAVQRLYDLLKMMGGL